MPLLATDTGGGDYERIPQDTYVARCYMLIHFGNVPDDYQGVSRRTNKVLIGWEIPEIMRQWKEGEPEKPAVISKEYTLSLSEKANLRKDLESWRGQKFTADELKGFDIEKLVGAPCLIQIMDKPSAKDPAKINSVVGSVGKIVKGMPVPDAITDKKIWLYDKFDMQLLESLPDFQKNKIKSSLEYADIMDSLEGKKKPAEAPPTLGEEDEDEPLPF